MSDVANVVTSAIPQVVTSALPSAAGEVKTRATSLAKQAASQFTKQVDYIVDKLTGGGLQLKANIKKSLCYPRAGRQRSPSLPRRSRCLERNPRHLPQPDQDGRPRGGLGGLLLLSRAMSP